MNFPCSTERRRDTLRNGPFAETWTGIDYVTVEDSRDPMDDDRQRFLTLHFVHPVRAELEDVHVEISGGERARNLRVESVTHDEESEPLVVDSGTYWSVYIVELDRAGDFSTYTLRVTLPAVTPPDEGQSIAPGLDAVDFSFKVNCPSPFDCAAETPCPPEVEEAQDIDYLAKDYQSFRRLMLDRMALSAPLWRERNPADLGVALVELLAYAGDYLSYRQDAIATEAYLGTARRRVSVRRHARLLDYPMHDGRNARAWVQIQVNENRSGTDVSPIIAAGTPFLTRVDGTAPSLQPESRAVDEALLAGADSFEAMEDVVSLIAEHNELRLYSWGGAGCCLPAGATTATLRGSHSELKGRVVVFVEERGAVTGAPGDADLSHRHPVRIVEAIARDDPLGGALDGAGDGPVEVTDITWAGEDALPFPLCLSRTAGDGGEEEVAVALGNIVLVDHGRTVVDEPIGSVPDMETGALLAPARFAPRLRERPVTQAARVLDLAGGGGPVFVPFETDGPAAAATAPPASVILPAVTVNGDETWLPRRDLLSGGPASREFVAEIEDDGTATLRFGDDRFGQRPNRGTAFTATYRVGNGTRGNVGIGAIGHIVTDQLSVADVVLVSNPLPASGGMDPESIEDVRQRAPGAFRTQERAVTAADYAAMAERHPEVQRAAATIRWTGSWRTVFLTVDRRGGGLVDPAFEGDLRDHLERYRLAGHDVEIDAPHNVPLEIGLHVCVARGANRGDVRLALTDLFSNRRLPDGRRGLFHPDELTFGQPVYLSRLYEAVLRTPGVDAVDFAAFARWGVTGSDGRGAGVLPMERLEVAVLDNNPNFPERGVLHLELEGGQ